MLFEFYAFWRKRMDAEFLQVDVFGRSPLAGNPLAIVLCGDTFPSTEAMQAFASFQNLSETVFVARSEREGCDYRVRIFVTMSELPFAGYVTLGACPAFLRGRAPSKRNCWFQECNDGLVVPVRLNGGMLEFESPPMTRSGPPDAETRQAVVASLILREEDVEDVAWTHNGPGWIAVLCKSAKNSAAVQTGQHSTRHWPRGTLRQRGQLRLRIRSARHVAWSRRRVCGRGGNRLAQRGGGRVADCERKSSENALLGVAGNLHRAKGPNSNRLHRRQSVDGGAVHTIVSGGKLHLDK